MLVSTARGASIHSAGGTGRVTALACSQAACQARKPRSEKNRGEPPPCSAASTGREPECPARRPPPGTPARKRRNRCTRPGESPACFRHVEAVHRRRVSPGRDERTRRHACGTWPPGPTLGSARVDRCRGSTPKGSPDDSGNALRPFLTPSSTPSGWRTASATPRSAPSTARPTCATRPGRAGRTGSRAAAPTTTGGTSPARPSWTCRGSSPTARPGSTSRCPRSTTWPPGSRPRA